MQRSRIYIKIVYTATACTRIILAEFIFLVIYNNNKLKAEILTLQVSRDILKLLLITNFILVSKFRKLLNP